MLNVPTRLVRSRALAKTVSAEMELFATMTMSVLTMPTTTATPMPNAQTNPDHIRAPAMSDLAATEQCAKITTNAVTKMAR